MGWDACVLWSFPPQAADALVKSYSRFPQAVDDGLYFMLRVLRQRPAHGDTHPTALDQEQPTDALSRVALSTL